MDHDQLINTVGILLITVAIIWALTRHVHENTRQSVTDRQTREDDQEEMKKYIRNIRSIPPAMPMTQERKLQLQKEYPMLPGEVMTDGQKQEMRDWIKVERKRRNDELDEIEKKLGPLPALGRYAWGMDWNKIPKDDHDTDHSTEAAEAESPRGGEANSFYGAFRNAMGQNVVLYPDQQFQIDREGDSYRWRLVPRSTEVEPAREGSQPGVDTIVTNQSTI